MGSCRKFSGAFTLAEVLITLGIIGVVAALTMPSLIANYQKKVYVDKLQKAYNTFSNAFAKYKADNETDTFENFGDEEVFEKFARKYFKVSKWCGTDKAGCMADSYYHNDKKSGSSIYDYSDISYSFRLASGESIRIIKGGWQPPAWVQIDINGPEGPNVSGRDFFIFDWYDKGLLAACLANNEYDSICKSGNGNGMCPYCFGRMVIEDGWQMRY